MTPAKLSLAAGGTTLTPAPETAESMSGAASLDLYEEVATIARPPVEPSSKRPLSDATGYILCVYRVFRGDDGEKFERNWLYWTGDAMASNCGIASIRAR